MTKIFIRLYLVVISIITIDSLENQWSGKRQLSKDYSFLWKTDSINKQVTFRVEVRTRGWVGFGISTNGKMTQSDLIIGWVTDRGNTVFNDYWVDRYERPSLDQRQDWFLTSGAENSSHTTLEFYRKYKTCDTLEDLEIHENLFEKSNIIWAFNDQDPISLKQLTKHDKQGVYHLNLFDQDDPVPESDVKVVDFTMNVKIPYTPYTHQANLPHQWICKFIKINFTEKIQFIKQHVLYDPPGLKLAFHLNLIKCPRHIFDKMAVNFTGIEMQCMEPPQSSLFAQCTTVIMASSGFIDDPFGAPPEVGYPFDQEQAGPYIMMQGYFKNTIFKPDRSFSVSLRLWFTGQLRKYNAGIVEMGVDFAESPGRNWGLLLPPKEPHFITTTVVDTYCFQDVMSDRGIFIFAVNMHSHMGRKTELRHYSHGQLLKVWRNYYYTFWNQPLSPIRPPLNLKMGDKLIIVCISNSTHLNKTIMSSEESCKLDAAYYPKIDGLTRVMSRIPYRNMLKLTGLEKIDGYSTDVVSNTIIRSPAKYNNTKLFDFLTDNKYKMNHAQLKKFLIKSHLVQCCDDIYLKIQVTKKCKIISKPPGLFTSLMNEQEHVNSCSNIKQEQSSAKNPEISETSNVKDQLSLVIRKHFEVLAKYLVVSIEPRSNIWVLLL